MTVAWNIQRTIMMLNGMTDKGWWTGQQEQTLGPSDQSTRNEGDWLPGRHSDDVYRQVHKNSAACNYSEGKTEASFIVRGEWMMAVVTRHRHM